MNLNLSRIRDLVNLLTPPEKRRLTVVFLAMVATAALEAIGVGSIFPFLSILSDPSIVESGGTIGQIYDFLGFTDVTSFLVVAGLGVFAIVVSTQAVSGFSTWYQAHFVQDVGHNMASRLLEQYLGKDYDFFIENNSSSLITQVISESRTVVAGILKPGITFLSNALTAVGIFAVLLFVEPIMTILAVGVIGGLYGAIYLSFRKRLQEIGRVRHQANKDRYKAAAEALKGFEDARLKGVEDHILDQFDDRDQAYASAVAKRSVYSQLPAHFMRALTFGGLIVILIGMILAGATMAQIVPTMGLFAFAGYRMMPAFQRIVGALTKFSVNEVILESLHDDLRRGRAEASQAPSQVDPLPFEEAVRFEDVSYEYPRSEEPVVVDVDLEIPKNSSLAFVGTTGAGKTTIVKLLLGLLQPTDGHMLVDGEPLGDSRRVRRWQRNVGYVPQDIFQTDDTIERNIAFGRPQEEIDPDDIQRAAEASHIHDFVQSLPEGYQTVIGEDGVRLSGGQRQRIGIARALYDDPEFLVLDEATSDVDTVTQANITRAIEELGEEVTMVVVAHRIDTIRKCEKICVVEDGRIAATGTYHELLDRSPKFRELTQEFEERITATADASGSNPDQ